MVERTKGEFRVNPTWKTGHMTYDSKTIGRNAVSREDVSNTNGEGLQGRGISTDLETEQRI